MPREFRATAAEARVSAASYATSIAQRLDAIVDLTRHLVEIDSPTDSPDGVGAVCEVLGPGGTRRGLRGGGVAGRWMRAAPRRATAPG